MRSVTRVRKNRADGQTDGSDRGRTRSLGAERRRQLRRERRRETLADLWRLLAFCGLATGLGYLVLDQGWHLSRPEQVEVGGSTNVGRERVLEVLELEFPVPLLDLPPQQISERLRASLAVEEIRVQRRMLPPRLLIDLTDREPVARAERLTPDGPEQGLVDLEGHWMRPEVLPSGQAPQTGIRVLGWQRRLRPTLEQVLRQRERMGSPLTTVRFEPDGSLWLTTQALGEVSLGPEDGRLERRIEVMRHLSETLPGKLGGQTVRSIDLSDPEQPEIGMPPGVVPKPEEDRKP
jgi:cell division protein FtsQ